MYVSIRKYKTDASGLIIPIVKNEFLSIIKNVPGFINYYLISSESDSGDLTTVSIFESKEGALASDKLAAEYAKESDLVKHLFAAPEIVAGEVKVTSEVPVHH
jgi:hypothetical protein